MHIIDYIYILSYKTLCINIMCLCIPSLLFAYVYKPTINLKSPFFKYGPIYIATKTFASIQIAGVSFVVLCLNPKTPSESMSEVTPAGYRFQNMITKTVCPNFCMVLKTSDPLKGCTCRPRPNARQKLSNTSETKYERHFLNLSCSIDIK